MQHIHYDQDKIERDIRAMFANYEPGDVYAQQVFKRSVDVQVAFTKTMAAEIMSGVPAEQLMEGVGHIITNLIHNAANLFQGAPREIVVAEILNEILNGTAFLLSQGDNAVVGSASVDAVEGGHA